MAGETYVKGWEMAKMSYYLGAAYVPIACITSRSESNESEIEEKISVCTLGEAETSVKQINRTVDLEGEAVDVASLDALKGLQNSLAEQTFKVQNTDGVATYFVGVITSLSGDYAADSDATFSMSVAINGEYTLIDPKA